MENKRRRVSISVEHGWRKTSETTAELVGGKIELDSGLPFEEAVGRAMEKVKTSMQAALGVCDESCFDENGTCKQLAVKYFARNDPRPDFKRTVEVFVSTSLKRPCADWEFSRCATIILRAEGTWSELDNDDIRRLRSTGTVLYWQPSIFAYREEEGEEEQEEEQNVSLFDSAVPYVITLETGYVFE